MSARLPTRIAASFCALALLLFAGSRGRALPTTVPSFALDGSNAVLRFQTGRVRDAPFAGQLSAFIANSGTWSVLSAGSSADPVADVDAMLCASRPNHIGPEGVVAARWVFVLRHPHDDAEVRHRIDMMSRSSGRTAVWSSTLGYANTPLPVDPSGFTPHAIVLTAPHEVVVAPTDDVDRVARVAALQHASGSSAIVEPLFAPESEREIAMIDLHPTADDDARMTMPDGSQTGRITFFHLLAERGTASVDIHTTITFAEAADATRAREQIRIAVAQIADTTSARMLGLSSILRGLTCEVRGASLVYDLPLTDRQVSLALGAMSLAGVGR